MNVDLEFGLLRFYPVAALAALRSAAPLVTLTDHEMTQGVHSIYSPKKEDEGTSVDIVRSQAIKKIFDRTSFPEIDCL